MFSSAKYRFALLSTKPESVGFSTSSKGLNSFDKTFHPGSKASRVPCLRIATRRRDVIVEKCAKVEHSAEMENG